MKITVFLLAFVSLQIYGTFVFSQNVKVKIPGPSLKVWQLIDEIESQTDYLFVYNRRNINLDRTVDIEGDNQTVAAILTKAFEGTDIKFIVEGSNIVLTKNEVYTNDRSSYINISGKVTDVNEEPIIGANVFEKGTANGTISDLNGNFSLEANRDGTLIVSFMGYKPEIVPVNGRTNFIIKLNDNILILDNVVVTAMGIQKKEASLTYSVQQITGQEVTRVKDPNLINSLAGKTAGVQINRSSSGLAGSAKVTIRGGRSLIGNNQPLYVIDGVPMLNTSNEQSVTIMGGTADAGNRDGGDGISNLNPDDIESINILKGASAAALYGSQAANGVILITTKKGRAGLQQITFSSNTTFDNPILLPKLQNTYGIDGDKMSWGKKGELKDYDNLGNFFRGGVTSINSVSFTRGSETVQTYFSYANTYGKGIIEGNDLKKHNLNFRETANFFDNKLVLDGNVNLMHQILKNRPTPGGFYTNPLIGLYTFARGEDITPYRDNFETFSKERNMYLQSWYKEISAFEQNPYWITNRIVSDDKRFRTIAHFSAKFKLTEWLTLQARGTADYISDRYTKKMYASTAPEIAGTYIPEGSNIGYANGRYINLDHNELLLYGDLMAMFNKKWEDWSVNAAIGASINHTAVNSLRLDSKTASLYYPNQFSVANIVMNANAYIDEALNNRRQLQSVFSTFQVGWKESLYVDVTARNDWSSTLAFTNNSNSFFYPSIGLSWVINNLMELPEWVSLGKVRTSLSQVGNDLPLFSSKLEDKIVAGGGIQANDRAPFDKLKPEISTSFEIGTEWKLFNNRLDLDFTYYKTSTKNQLLTLPTPTGDFYKFRMVNAGKIENKGLEIAVGATPVLNSDFRWKAGFNFSTNKNKIVKLHPELNSFIYGSEGFSMNYAMRLEEGGSFGDIYGWKFDRDENGKIRLDSNGLPTSVGSGNKEKVGNSSPDCMLGFGNTLTFKGLSFYFLIDARIGGDLFCVTQAELDYYGVSKVTAEARDKGFVEVEGQRFTDVQAFYKNISARNSCITEYYMSGATNVRLREFSLGYSFSRKLLDKLNIFSSVNVSLIGRNLFFFYNKAPFDPDVVMSTDNSCQGVDVFGMPTTRSLGFNIRLTL